MSFSLVSEQHIADIASLVRVYRHDKTSARFVSVINDDQNKAFGITFRTPPASSNGIAHIMEHTVLCGSRKYPAKDPFIQLAKGSLNTFLNAMTFGDKTSYPVASQNVKDLYNLIDVYLDAVFYPLLTEQKLQQEGWHYELESPDAPLTFNGIVFNEMKGNYSSPDGMISWDYSTSSLFPDTIYGVDSGGDPAEIPNLTFSEFQAFHQRFYHPSNSYIWFYGDDDADERLRYLDAWLNEFEAREIDAEIPLQPRFSEPRSVKHEYDSGDNDEAKSFITVNWMLPETGHEDSLGLMILDHILTATPASPLRKTLLDSGLGEDLIGVGFYDGIRQMMFSVGMKGVESEQLPAVEQLVLDTLNQLASDGLDPDTIAAAINTTEFRLREQNTGSFPRGLALMFGTLSTWFHGGDPIEALQFEGDLQRVKDKIANGERYFENLIREHLLDNSHRTTVTLEPDPTVNQRRDEAEATRLASTKAAMSLDDLENVIANVAALKKAQETPDAPDIVATIPMLTLDDLDKHNKTIPIDVTHEGKTTVIHHDLATSGILYFNVGFDMHSVPANLLPYLGVFGSALLEMGTNKRDFVQLMQWIGQTTGGINASKIIGTKRDSDESALWFVLTGKAVLSHVDDMLAIMREVLLEANLDNPERFKQIVLEEKAGLESGVVRGGHAVASRRIRAHFNESSWFSEQVGGVEYLFFIRQLVETVTNDWASVLKNLEALRDVLINRNAMFVNATLDQAAWDEVRPNVVNFINQLPAKPFKAQTWERQPLPRNEGLTIPSQVNYVGKGANLYELGYEPHGSVNVITNYLGTSWLWEQIRVLGGAYGGFSQFDMTTGTWTFLSYRDPNLHQTLQRYDNTVEFLRTLDLNENERSKAIIGTIGDMDSYQLPSAKGYTSLVRYLTNYSDDMRQQIRDEVLNTSEEDFRRFADMLERLNQHGNVVVVGSADAINKANAEHDLGLDIKQLL